MLLVVVENDHYSITTGKMITTGITYSLRGKATCKSSNVIYI